MLLCSYLLIPHMMNTTFTPSQQRQLRQKLEAIRDDEPNSIRAYVADEALTYQDDDPSLLFRNLQHCGCAGGAVCSLTYYCDTHEFFDCYYDEIEELREEYEDSVGEPLRINRDLKNFLAWFAFEEIAYRMANELELD